MDLKSRRYEDADAEDAKRRLSTGGSMSESDARSEDSQEGGGEKNGDGKGQLLEWSEEEEEEEEGGGMIVDVDVSDGGMMLLTAFSPSIRWLQGNAHVSLHVSHMPPAH